MKQLHVKAVQFLMEIEGNSNVTIEDHDFENIKAAVVLLLKEQDRDTRNACLGVIDSFDKNTIYKMEKRCKVETHTVTCKKGFFSVTSSNKEEAMREARHYFIQYFEDGEYN